MSPQEIVAIELISAAQVHLKEGCVRSAFICMEQAKNCLADPDKLTLMAGEEADAFVSKIYP